MVEAFTAKGVNLSWDCDLDLGDRRVMQGVARAMRRSRFVGLYVSDRYEDSPWCRAEYLNALWVEEKYEIQRVLVINESSSSTSRIPGSLCKAPVFGAANVDQLAQFVLSENFRGSRSAERLRHQVPASRLSQNVESLTFDEQLNILEQRLIFWVERGSSEIKFSNTERAAAELTKLMSDAITEPEIIFRDVRDIAFASGMSDQPRTDLGEQELWRVVRMMENVSLCYSSSVRLWELVGLDKWAYDFLLKPILLAVEANPTRSAATAAFRGLCSGLVAGPFKHEVPVYLRVLQAVESERQDTPGAIFSHRAPLYDAASQGERWAYS